MNLYQKYHLFRDDTRIGLFTSISKEYGNGRVLYPGCFVHISPSFVFHEVVYVDTMKSALRFFKGEEIKEIIQKNKQYEKESNHRFMISDYSKIKEDIGKFDLLLSQYAGFISQDCKQHLNKNALLVVNNSHGDATMAHLDEDYKLIGIYRRNSDENYTISDKNLDQYFVPKKGQHPDMEQMRKLGKGIGYTKSPSGYIFKYVK